MAAANTGAGSPVRLLIHGANGRMGRAVLRLCGERDDCVVVAAISRRKPGQRVVDGVAFLAASEMHAAPAFDVAIDFSLPEAFDAVLALCRERGAALVSGTTGLSPAQQQAMQAASGDIALLWASNFSLGVALLHELVGRAAQALPHWDCDIVEMHHRGKRDAPSGTALTLAEAAAQGGAQARIASLRAGDIVGEHCVQFSGPGERLELVHRAGNRDVFAHGALQAAAWLARKSPGSYAMRDLLGTQSALASTHEAR
ncbi:4-hydroxy-tetrahydrodipicolinate reductase [Luteimonas sp. e5]